MELKLFNIAEDERRLGLSRGALSYRLEKCELEGR